MKRKIVFCIDSLSKGGAERVLVNLANAFSEKYDVAIIALAKTPVAYKLDKKVKLHMLSAGGNSKIMRPVRVPLRLIGFNNILRQIKPDVIISFLPKTVLSSLFLSRGKYKIIVSERNDPAKTYSRFPYSYLAKTLFPYSSGFVFQTADAKNYFANILKRSNAPRRIILNPVTETFIGGRRLARPEKTIISIGRLVDQKNHELLIDAFYQISDEFPDYNLVIYGEGPNRKNLEEKIKTLNLTNRVSLPGATNNIKDELLKSSLFVLSSDYEGMPNALIEAMILGTPSISTDCPVGGPRELIADNKNGWLVPINNVNKLATTMKTALSNSRRSENIGREAKKTISKVHPKIVVSQWDQLINDVLKGAGNV